MEYLLILLVVVAFVTLIGHGIWAGIAWLLRGGRSRHSPSRYEPTLDDDRAAAARFATHLKTRGLIDEDTHARVMRAVSEDLRPSGHSVEAYLSQKREHEESDQVAAEPPVPARSPAPAEPEPSSPDPDPLTQFQPAAAEPQISRIPAAIPTFQIPTEPQSPVRAPAPKRAFSEILSSFMAEKNIRWGELIGGLLIVCSSAALVISLWSRIEAIPVLKFVIFTAVTTALFGAGLFVHHRWKIPTTGQVVLLVATLLVPLNLLAFSAFSLRGPVRDSWTTPIELAAVALFGWLSLVAARVVMPAAPRLFAAGIVGVSATALAVRLVSPLAGAPLWGMALLPIVLFVAVMIVSFPRLVLGRRVDEAGARHLFLLLGAQTLACLVPFGLVAYESGLGASALAFLAPLVCVLPVPALFTGVFIWRRLEHGVASQTRVAAASVALVAAAVMLVGAGLAWPLPSRLVPATIVVGVAAAALSRVVRHPAVHASAAGWFSAAWIIIAHVWAGLPLTSQSGSRLLAALASGKTGQFLVAAAAACILIAAWFRRRNRRVVSHTYATVAAVIAAVSVVHVTISGFGRAGDPELVFWVYAVYAIASFVAASRTNSRFGVLCGGLLGQMAISQLFVFLWPDGALTWPTGLLAGASCCAAGALAIRISKRGHGFDQLFATLLAQVGVASSLLALVLLLWHIPTVSLGGIATRFWWLSGVWLALAIVLRQSVLIAGAQLAMFCAVATGLHLRMQSASWYADALSPLADPRLLQLHAIGASVICLFWTAVRRAFDWMNARASLDDAELISTQGESRHWTSAAKELLNPVIPLADRWMTAPVVAVLAILSLWSVAPRIVAEHGWADLPTSTSLHLQAASWQTWVLISVLVANLLLQVSKRVRFLPVLGLVLMVACATLMAVARFEGQHQIVTLVRWSFASIFLLLACVVWMRGLVRQKLTEQTRHDIAEAGIVEWAPAMLCALFAAPVVILTLTSTYAAAADMAMLPQSVSELGLRLLLIGPPTLIAIGLMGFGRREWQPAFAVAAAVLACVIVTTTELCLLIRANTTMSIAYLVWLVQLNAIVSSSVALVWRTLHGWGQHLDTSRCYARWPLWIARSALGAILLAGAVSLWLHPGAVPAFVTAAGTAWGVVSVVLVELALWSAAAQSTSRQQEDTASVRVFFGAVLAASLVARFDTGNWLCFHVLLLGIVSAGWLRLQFGAREVRRLLGSGWHETYETASANADGVTHEIRHDVTCLQCGYNLRGLESTGRCPECSETIGASLKAVSERLTPEWAGRLARAKAHTATAVLACVALTMLFALRAAFDDPQRPWWAVGALTTTGALCIVLAGWTPKRAFAYAGCLQICLAASTWWLIEGRSRALTFTIADLCDLANVNIIAIALAGLAWLGVERRLLRGQAVEGLAGRWPPLHRFAACVSSAALLLLAGVALGGIVANQPLGGSVALQWLAMGASAALMFACRIDVAFRLSAAGLYTLGLAALILTIAHAKPPSSALAWWTSLGLGGYALATTLIWRRGALADRGLHPQPHNDSWLLAANGLLAGVALILSVYVSFTNPSTTVRLLAVVSPILCAGAAMLAAIGGRREWLQTIGLSLVVAGAILVSWIWVAPGSSPFLIYRAISVIVATLAVTLAASAARRIDSEGRWDIAVSRSVSGAVLLAGVSILFCSGSEALALASGEAVQWVNSAVLAFIAALAVLVVACVVFAVRDDLDPLRLRASLKGGYVYAAECLAGALVLHVRASMPWLFSGVITQYWPMLVMGLAFAAIGAGELCARRGLRVLSRPLSRTGMFLPSLGMIELFLTSSQVHFSIVLLTIGALYAILAGLRKSVRLGFLAAMAFNGSLWYLLAHSPALGLTRHPQLWFIPPAFAILAAAHFNRERLSTEQRTAVHYVCLLIVYLSSTADVFLVGVAQAPWLPLVLMGLSLVGILAGFLSRIRPFLFLGSGFLCLSLLTMIWHAASNLGWTWVWYVAGIVLGAGIITFFALFEKKRNEMNAWLDGLRKWES